MINTEHLVLRPLRETDIPDIYGLMSDFETAARTGFRPMGSSSEAEGFVRRRIRSGLAYGLALIEKQEEIIGLAVLTKSKSGTGCGSEHLTYTFAYFLRADMRGKGYMPEAVNALKRHLFDNFGADRLIIFLVPANNSSRRVAQKCGFKLDTSEYGIGRDYITGKDVELESYTLTRQEYGERPEDIREVKEYRQAIVNSTCDEMIRLRGIALSKINETSRPEQRNALMRAFLQDCIFPGNIYQSRDWDDAVRKMRLLFSFGTRKKDAIWQVVYALCRNQVRSAGNSEFHFAEDTVRWLRSEGSDINAVNENSTALDLLVRTVPELRSAEAPDNSIVGMLKIIDLVKELGGRPVYNTEDMKQ